MAAAGVERDNLYRQLVSQQYANGSAINMATVLEIDAVIDPADTRGWIVRGLDGAASGRASGGAPNRFIDCW